MYFGPEIGIFKYNLGSLISPMPKNGIQIHTDIFSEYNVVCPNGLITKIPQILYELSKYICMYTIERTICTSKLKIILPI